MASKSLLPLIPTGLVVDSVTVGADLVTVTAHLRSPVAACPLCHEHSHRVHSRYQRHLGDLPWQGRAVELHLQVRRFRCPDPECPCRIFAERLPAVAAPHARRTHRLAEIQRHIGFGMGGEPGARLSGRLAMPVSRDTLLRLIRAAPSIRPPESRIIGIDDWAWRRGHRYGTIICDLERQRPIDVLPDRRAETVAAWLQAHPGIRIVARDRAGAYADGVRMGAPAAIQVADRWHLLRNLGTAMAGVLDRHHRDLRVATKAATPTMMAEAPVPTPQPSSPTPSQQRSLQKHAVRQARFDEVITLHARGIPLKRIARAVGLDRKTVRGWLRSRQLPTWSQPLHGSSVDAHGEYLRRRWGQGCHNATRLWREIRELGFLGQAKTVQRWIRHLRDTDPVSTTVPSGSAWKRPFGRRAAWLVVADADELTAAEHRFVDALIAGTPALGPVIRLAREFRAMVRQKRVDRLETWLMAARETALAGFADGLKRDLAAVRAALSLPWSTGPVEGQICRLKTIKRTMQGRAAFDLFRQRVLGAA